MNSESIRRGTLAGVLRAAFRLTALLFIPVGLFVYFLPPDVATLLGVSPLWMARVLGGLLFAWGVFQLAAAQRPDGVKVAGVAGGNLLILAALLPPALRAGDTMPGGLRLALFILSALLAILAVTAIVSYPSGGSPRGR